MLGKVYSLGDIAKVVYKIMLGCEKMNRVEVFDRLVKDEDVLECDRNKVKRRMFDVLNILIGSGIVIVENNRLMLYLYDGVKVLKRKVLRLLMYFLVSYYMSVGKNRCIGYVVGVRGGYKFGFIDNTLTIYARRLYIYDYMVVLSKIRLRIESVNAFINSNEIMRDVFCGLTRMRAFEIDNILYFKINNFYLY